VQQFGAVNGHSPTCPRLGCVLRQLQPAQMDVRVSLCNSAGFALGTQYCARMRLRRHYADAGAHEYELQAYECRSLKSTDAATHGSDKLPHPLHARCCGSPASCQVHARVATHKVSLQKRVATKTVRSLFSSLSFCDHPLSDGS
jgi:hypothetical protein